MSPEALIAFQKRCRDYVCKHENFFLCAIRMIIESPLAKNIYAPVPATGFPDDVFADWHYDSWPAQRWIDIMSRRCGLTDEEAKAQADKWREMVSPILVPIRLVWNMVKAMSVTKEGVPQTVRALLACSGCLKTMLYVSLRDYIARTPKCLYSEWAFHHIDHGLFCLDANDVHRMLETSVFGTFILDIAERSAVMTAENVLTITTGISRKVLHLPGWLAVKKAQTYGAFLFQYAMSPVLQDCLLVNPEVFLLRERIRNWMDGMVKSSRTVGARTLEMIVAVSTHEVKGLVVRQPEESEPESETLACTDMGRLQAFAPEDVSTARCASTFVMALRPVLDEPVVETKKRKREDE